MTLTPLARLAARAMLALTTLAGLPAASEPIARTAHGALFGPDGQVLKTDLANLSALQDHYFARWADSASRAFQAALAHRQRYIDDISGGDLQARLYARTLLLDWALDQQTPSPASNALRVKVAVMREQLRRPPADFASATTDAATTALPRSLPERGFVLPAHTQALLRGIQLVEPLAVPGPPTGAVLQARLDYIAECTAAGVPIPPTWGQAAWKTNKAALDQGNLATKFIDIGLAAKVFYFESKAPAGLCIALPRFSNTTDISNLGIICMGKGKAPSPGAPVESHACFWDNQASATPGAPGVGFSVPWGQEVPLLRFAAGPQLLGGSGNICSDCHSGENAFVVHPDDGAFQVRDSGLPLPMLKPDAWVKPHVHRDWPQNPEPAVDILAGVVSPEKCNSCHRKGKNGRLPVLNTSVPQYCSSVLAPSLRFTMPRGKAANVRHDPDYLPDIKVLLDACATPPPAPP